jgi:hypothetical protein
LWICGCAILTQEGAIGATIIGRGCAASSFYTIYYGGDGYYNDQIQGNLNPDAECRVVVWYDQPNDDSPVAAAINASMPCEDLWDTATSLAATQPIPGSNLYVSVWTCLAASIHITLRWKAQQAIQFAAQAEQRQQQNESKDDFDDDSDLEGDEFVDAVDE